MINTDATHTSRRPNGRRKPAGNYWRFHDGIKECRMDRLSPVARRSLRELGVPTTDWPR